MPHSGAEIITLFVERHNYVQNLTKLFLLIRHCEMLDLGQRVILLDSSLMFRLHSLLECLGSFLRQNYANKKTAN